MISRICLPLLLLGVLITPAPAAPESVLGALEAEVQAILDRSLPAVVRVEASRKRALSVSMQGGGGISVVPTITEHSLGAGFVVGEDGLVFASDAVVADADGIRLTFASGLKTSAKIVDTNAFYRVAVLRADEVPEGLKPLEISDREPRVGSFSILCGRAHDAGPSAMLGLLCDTRRAYLGFDRFLVVSSTLTPGESGAPFLGSDGKVMGLGSASVTDRNVYVSSGGPDGSSRRQTTSCPSRLACCVPASDLRRILADVTRHGRIQQAWLGVTIRTEKPVITGVVRNSPAESVKLAPGDLVLGIDGTPIESRMQLVGILARLRPGTVATFRIERDEKPLEIEIPLLQRPKDHERCLLCEKDGIRIMRVPDGCKASIKLGDLIIAVNGKPATDPQVVFEALAAFGGPTPVEIVLMRGKVRNTMMSGGE